MIFKLYCAILVSLLLLSCTQSDTAAVISCGLTFATAQLPGPALLSSVPKKIAVAAVVAGSTGGTEDLLTQLVTSGSVDVNQVGEAAGNAATVGGVGVMVGALVYARGGLTEGAATLLGETASGFIEFLIEFVYNSKQDKNQTPSGQKQ